MLNIDLFEKIDNNQILELLKCMGIKTRTYKPNSYILKTGSSVDYLGVILDGSAYIRKSDSANIIEKLNVNDIFGHNIVCLGQKKSPVDIVSEKGCEVLFLPFDKLVTPCEKLCSYHLQLIRNIMKMISKRNTLLEDKVDIIGLKTIREKILALLDIYKTAQGTFTIPYSREQMAKFLCTDRCALSRELSKMQKEGIIRFSKNNFELLKN